MRCSASGMYATDNFKDCTCVIRKSIYSILNRIDISLNPIVKSIVGETCIVRRPSVTYEPHYCIRLLCSFDLA